MNSIDFQMLAQKLTSTAHRAGRAIMSHYEDEISVDYKDDSSPVTAADKAAEAIIIDDLKIVAPSIPVVAEEAVSSGNIPATGSRFFLVDPLDGTKEFIHKRGEFTVNIALIEDGHPVFGLVYAPAVGKAYVTPARQAAVEFDLSPGDEMLVWDALNITPIHTRPANRDELACVASRSHRDQATDDFLQSYNVKSLISAGSSIKFCLVARGEADLYPRFGRTMEWDTAAGHAVLAAAGGTVTRTDGSPFLYGKADEGFANPGFIAWGGAPIAPGTS